MQFHRLEIMTRLSPSPAPLEWVRRLERTSRVLRTPLLAKTNGHFVAFFCAKNGAFLVFLGVRVFCFRLRYHQMHTVLSLAPSQQGEGAW